MANPLSVLSFYGLILYRFFIDFWGFRDSGWSNRPTAYSLNTGSGSPPSQVTSLPIFPSVIDLFMLLWGMVLAVNLSDQQARLC